MTEAEARAAMEIEPTKGLKDHEHNPKGNAWEVVTPAGWCFEQGRHTQIEHTKAQAVRVARDEPIEVCSAECDCRYDGP